MKISFNTPFMTGKELWYIAEVHANCNFAGDGGSTKQCYAWLEASTGAQKTLLAHSCFAALKIAVLLADLQHNNALSL
jgi:dTDP-4-amino-4,6-dideoxygalactose transaminase